jgi:imidazoleglycerol-phosphate dehydratase/histidinol-phosphatase
MTKVVFIDRDGTIVREPRDEQVDTLEKLEFMPGIVSGLKLLVDAGYSLVMVSNQDGLGTKRYPRSAYNTVQKKIVGMLAGEGIAFDDVFICPHLETAGCECRKPKVGLVRGYIRTHRIDPVRSFVLGDRETDVQFARNLGLKSVRLTRAGGTRATYRAKNAVDACRSILRWNRFGSVHRKTNETDIEVHVVIDGEGNYDISTGVGFFDHMLEQLARHSKIDVRIKARGDILVDEHHTVEDVGIALGEAVREALGNKRGIERFSAPLDESLASVVLDLSGRSHLTFNCAFRRETVGGLPTELVEDFFLGFVHGLRATLHITCDGRNDHHKIEAIFKSVGRALKSATAIDFRRSGAVPSTKGLL